MYNANCFTVPALDENNIIRSWQELHKKYSVELYVCVAAALRRGVIDNLEAEQIGLPSGNIQVGFSLRGLETLAQILLTCGRLVQF